MNEFNFVKNPAQENKNVINPEQLHLHTKEMKKEPDFSPEQLDHELNKMEIMIEKIERMELDMTPEEVSYVQEAIQQDQEGKNILGALQEKTQHMFHAGHHLSGELSDQYNPRVVKTVQKLGKVIGALGGMMVGHGVASAAGAVAGAKIGEYGALKTFEKISERLPDSWKERIKKPEDQMEIEKNQETIKQKTEQLEQLDSDIENLSTEIENLSPEEREKFNQLMEQDTKTVSTIDRIKNAYVRYGEFCEHFETKYPILGTATDFALHASLGPVLHSLELGKGAIHAIEVLAATGGTEKMTSHCLHAFEKMKHSAKNVQQKISSLLNKQSVEPVALTA